MWFALPSSWKGSQNAVKLASLPAFAASGSKPAIQICARVPAGILRPYARRLENVNHMSFFVRQVWTTGAHFGHESPFGEPAFARAIADPPPDATYWSDASGASYDPFFEGSPAWLKR